MTDPISFASLSPRFGLPLLFSGQAQKEFFVNEAHALTDALLHPAVEGEADSPPAVPEDGECWLVGMNPTGEWAGQAGKLACLQLDTWIFVSPRDGMRLLDRNSGQELRYRRGWVRPIAPAAPTGGVTVDAEARVSIDRILGVLVAAGILPDS